MDEQDISMIASSAANMFLILSRYMHAEEMLFRITATHGLRVAIVEMDQEDQEREH